MDLPSKTYLQECRKSSPRTVGRNCEVWFNAVYDQHMSPNQEHSFSPPEPMVGPIEAGKIYTYTYDPKYANDLPIYDTQPMFLSLGHLDNGNILGINVSYIPPRVRLRILDKFVRVFHFRFIKPNTYFLEKGKPAAMKEIPFFYDIAKGMLAGSGFEAAIRSYRYDHIITAPKVITYADYWRLLAFTSAGIMKLNIRAAYFIYKQKTNSLYKLGHKDPKIQIDKGVRPIQKQIKNRSNK